MAGGVMTTGQSKCRTQVRLQKSRTKMRLQNERCPLDSGQGTSRLTPDTADLMRHTMVTTGSLGADAPPG